MNGWTAIAGRINSDRLQRWGLATFIAVALHVVLLALILGWRSPPTITGYQGVDVSLLAVPGHGEGASESADRPAATPAKAKLSLSTTPLNTDAIGSVSTLKEQPKFDPPPDLQPILVNVVVGSPPASTGIGQADVASVVSSPPSASAGATTKACKIYDALQSTLQVSAEVRSALNLIPAKSRSVANAVLLWDGRWVEAGVVGGAPALGPIQSAVVSSIGQAPVPCQEELVRGPRVITVGDSRNTIVLAFGSGEWRWADLLKDVPAPRLP